MKPYRFDMLTFNPICFDDEYRYWAFIEMHVLRAIVEGARKDAIDALRWSYTDCLLTHPNLPPTPPPFSQDDCIELFKLLNGVGPSHPFPVASSKTFPRPRRYESPAWNNADASHFTCHDLLPAIEDAHNISNLLTALSGLGTLGSPKKSAEREQMSKSDSQGTIKTIKMLKTILL
jgi:hypothetical protein